MGLLKSIRVAFKSLFRRGQTESDLDEELRFHLEQQTQYNIEQGMSPTAAARAARISFGGIDQAKEHCRDAWGTRLVQDLWRDFRFTINSLRRSPVFSITVITTIALCVAANTTVLSALYSFILKPLPFAEPERLVQVYNIGETSAHGREGSHGRLPSMSGWTQYLDFKENATLFDGFALRKPVAKIIELNGSARRIKGHSVNANFFALLGIKPVIGRFFTLGEVDPGNSHVVVLTQSLWETEYQADLAVLGRQVRFDNGIVYTIIGVAPRSVEALDFESRFFIPYELNRHSRDIQVRYGEGADLWARLKPGVNRESARNQLALIEQHWVEEVADKNGLAHLAYHKMSGIKFDLIHPLKNSLSLLQAGALFVLAVGCLNIMTLLMGRSGQRQHELAIRNALGAGKSSIRRLMLIESSTLMAIAIAVGGALSWGGLRLINAHLVVLDPGASPITMDGAVVTTTVIIGIVAALFMGLIPLELFWKTGLLDRVNNTRTSSMNRKTKRTIDGLVIGQIAFAFTLLIGAGLMLRSFANVSSVPPGFDATHIIKGRIEARAFYQHYSDTAELRRRVLAAMQSIPGVQNAAASQYKSFAPYSMENMRDFVLNGAPWDASQRVVRHLVSADFFQTMGISLLNGRTFNDGDYERGYIVDEAFAQRFLEARIAIGAELHMDNKPPRAGTNWKRIVGVVSRANLRGLEQRDGNPIVYTLMEDTTGSWSFTILLRTNRHTEDVIRDMRSKLHEIDPRLPLLEVETLQKALDEMLLARRGITILSGAFAALALLLSIMGIYAVLSYDVLQRRKAIGIRNALGATRWQLLSMVLMQGLTKTVIGLVLGTVGAVATSHYLSSQLFDVTPFDPITYLAVAAVLLIVGAAASYVPARRATKVDPMIALRSE